jgi:hypothetical protein
MLMSDPISDSARAAAERLSSELGDQVVADVETALHTRGLEQGPPDQYFDPITLGGLIVSIATLGWKVYTDLKAKTPKPAPEVIERTVRVKVQSENRDNIPAAQLDRIVEVVISETVRAASERG